MRLSCLSVAWTCLIWTDLVLSALGAEPSITVWPPNPHYVTTGSTWTEPGVFCNDGEDGIIDVTTTPSFVDTSSNGTFILTYTCIDNWEWTRTGYQNWQTWNSVKATREVIVRDVPTIAIAGAAVMAISPGAFGPRWSGFCRDATSGNQQSAGLVSLDTVSSAFSWDRQAKCLSLCRHYQSVNAMNGKGCELRVTGATNPGCYMHTQTITTSGANNANYFCWKAEFNDPGGCCQNADNEGLTVLQTSYPISEDSTRFQIEYWCEDPLTEAVVTTTRDLNIDFPPQLWMNGEANVETTRGAIYTDLGVWCHDPEDGPIIELPLGAYSDIKIVSTTMSGSTGNPNYFATFDGFTTGGPYGGTGTSCNACHETAADGNGKHWIRLDLGQVRIVHRVKIHKMAGTWTIRVGTSEVSSRNPTCGTTGNAAGLETITCVAQLAGRFVNIESSDVDLSLTLCEVTLDGQPGPSPPSTFNITSGCTSLHGTYVLAGSAEGLPSWKKDDDQTAVIMYEGVGFVLKHGATVHARASEGASLPAAVWASVTGSCVPQLVIEPSDGCTWLFGFSSGNDLFKCADGTEQATSGNCDNRGGVARCPPNLPQACAFGGGCAADCSVSNGGARSCGTSGKAGTLSSIPYFTASAVTTGYRNDLHGDYGIAFIPKTNVYITHLGRHEATGTTLVNTTQVTLWSTSTQQALGQVQVGPSSTLESNYRMQALGTTVMLQATVEYRLTQQCSVGMPDSWNDAIEQQANLFSTTEWRYIDFVGGASKTSGYGYPDTTDSALQRPGMVNFKYWVPAARIEQVGTLNSPIAGYQTLVFLCTDTMGQRSATSRTIKVGCEGPNPRGQFGGNKVTCAVEIGVQAKANFNACGDWCLEDTNCELAEFITNTSVCTKKRQCTGRYEWDDHAYRQVGICKVVNNPPAVVLGAAMQWVVKDGTWTPGLVTCQDNEDQVPPTPVQESMLSTAVPGTFDVTYSCTDSAGLRGEASYTVTVKDDCVTNNFADPNMHPDGPCQGFIGQNHVFKYGQACLPRCTTGYAGVDQDVMCTTATLRDHQSAWELHPTLNEDDDPSTMIDFECGELPCPALTVANTRLVNGNAQSCVEGTLIMNGKPCTTNCLDGYVAHGAEVNETLPTISAPLMCDRGNFIPEIYQCLLPAAPPTITMFGTIEVLHVPLYWTGGAANDCTFSHWRLESRQTVPGYEETSIIPGNEVWQPVPGCGSVNHTSRTTLTCHAYYRIEGATYEWRAKEECKKSVDLNSTWSAIMTVTMRVVVPPEVLFRIPAGDTTFDPMTLMIAFTVPITITQHVRFGQCLLCQLLDPAESIWVNISRTGTWCVDSTGGFGGLDWYVTKSEEVIDSGGATGDYVRITGGRIAIIKPPEDWLGPGCDFNVTMDLGSMQTQDVPAKPTPWYQFNFTHIDLAPEFVQFVLGVKTTVTVDFKIYWNLVTMCNCSLIPTAETCPANPDPSDLGCARHALPVKSQVSDIGFVDYFVTGLYPGTEYRTLCDGIKYGKPWIPIVPIPVERYAEVTFETLPDTDSSISHFHLNVTAVCDPVNNPGVHIHMESRFKSIMPPQFPLGYTLQMLDWRDTCVGGRAMNHGESARFIVTATTAATSVFAVVQWIAEPQANDVLVTTHTYDYTKDITVNADPIVFTFRFNICPLAAILVPDGPVQCQPYQIVVQAVDISFNFTSFALESDMDSLFLQRKPEDYDNVTFPVYQSADYYYPSDYWWSRRLENLVSDYFLNSSLENSTEEEGEIEHREAIDFLQKALSGQIKLTNITGKHGPHGLQARDPDKSGLSPEFMEKLQGFAVTAPDVPVADALPAPEVSSQSEQAASLLKSLFSIVDDARQEVQKGNAESLGVALKRIIPGNRSAPGRGLSQAHFTVDVGTAYILTIAVDRLAFDWTTISLHVGPIRGIDGFTQFLSFTGNTEPNEPVAMVLTGQGTRLPVSLQWEGVTFLTPYEVSFTSPNLSVPTYEAPLDVTSILRVNLGNVPNVSALITKTNPQVHTTGDTTAGYGAPENFIQIGVYKDGRSENLCGPLTWPDVDDWTNAQCNLLPAALLNITVVLTVKDYADSVFRMVNATLTRDQVTYKLPTHTGLKDAGDWALMMDNSIDLAMVSQRSVADVYPQGDRLPSLAVLQLGGATLPGYEMRIQGDYEVQMCQTITWVNASALNCILAKCINITQVVEKPSLRMYVGDLVTNSAVPGLLTVPRPIVDSWSPTIIDDVGRNQTILIWGKHFGEMSCQDSHPDATQLLGSPTGVQIYVGEWRAQCVVQWQNNTFIVCQISSPISDPLDPTYTGTAHPPARRTSLQTWTLRKGVYLTAKNEDQMNNVRGGRRLPADNKTTAVRVLEEEVWEESEDDWLERQLQAASSKYVRLEFTVKLMDCPAGYRRTSLTEDVCEPCRPGRFNTILSESWPLRCDPCPEATYADQEGSTACKDCPANTFAATPASSIEACLCKPGYYSQYYNETTKRTTPGTPCLSCSTQTMTDEPLPRKEKCGASLAIATYCDVFDVPCCAPERVGVMYYRVCKAYCPGGTTWPIPKWTFAELNLRQISGPGAIVEGGDPLAPPMFEPQLARCDPPIACMNAGACHHKYTGYGCGECVFGYYRDKYSKECVPCGEEQVIGMIIMAAVTMMMSVGGLFGSSAFMRFKSDIVFEHEMKLAAKEFILEPLLKSKGFLAVCSPRANRKLIVLHKWDVGASFRFAQSGHLGMVWRVDVKGVIHLAGLLDRSPVDSLVKPGWKLLSVNGVRPKATSEGQVHAFIKKAKFPLRLIFACPKGGHGTGEVEGLDNDRKMIVMLMGVMNAFNQISMFDFEWPPMFLWLAAFAAQFAFSFNFFHPECSVPTPFNTKWKGFLAVPYMMLMPLTAALVIVRLTAFPRGAKGETLKARMWMLRNAFARTVCMAVIALVPMHIEQLLVPFACVERAEGTYFVSATPDTVCSFEDPRYKEMLMIGFFGGSVFLFCYSMLLLALWRSFAWQWGLKVRDDVPFYAGMVEVSVFGQRGYVEESRWRVMNNVICCNLFDPTIPLLSIRERLEWASEYMHFRSRKGRHEKIKKYFAESSMRRKFIPEEYKPDPVINKDGEEEEEEPEIGIENEETAAGARRALKAGIRRWKKSKFALPEKKDGNVITYGWILIVNLFWRQLLSLMTIKMSEGNLVVVGAAMLMLIMGGNVTMLIIFKPYKSRKISDIESTMLAALFMILWGAVIKDLLSNHINAHTFADTMVKVNNGIDAMALTIMTLVIVMPGQALHEIAMKILNSIQSKDSLLNEIYMVQTRRIERDADDKRRDRLADEAADMDSQGDLILPADIERRYPTIAEAVAKINESLVVPSLEQRRKFVHFIHIIRALPEDAPVHNVEMLNKFKGAVKGVIEEESAMHAFEKNHEDNEVLHRKSRMEREQDEAMAHVDPDLLEKALPCLNGHPLLEWSTTSDEWWCSRCGITCYRGTWVQRCFKCNYHLCPKCCYDFKVGGLCNHNHILEPAQRFPLAPHFSVCYVCEEFIEGKDRWTCKECNFKVDYCYKCRPKESELVIYKPNRCVFLDPEDLLEPEDKGFFGRVFGFAFPSKSSGKAAPKSNAKPEEIDEEKEDQERMQPMKTLDAFEASMKLPNRPNAQFKPEQKVRVVNMTRNKKLNGQIGTIMHWEDASKYKDGKARWKVHMDDLSSHDFLASNLEALKESSPLLPVPPPPPEQSSRSSRSSSSGPKAAPKRWPARLQTDSFDDLDDIELKDAKKPLQTKPLPDRLESSDDEDELHF